MPSASRHRLLALPVLLALGVAALPAEAASPSKRTFLCGDGQGDIVVTVLSQKTIRARIAMDGNETFTATMKKKGAGFRFVDGEYEIKIANNQNSLVYTAPDFGEIGCVWSH
ncbi:MAG: hypothetical protein ABI399_12455 [Bauldia sp.]